MGGLPLTRCCMYGPSPDPQLPRAAAGAPACVRPVRCRFASQQALSPLDARASCASGVNSLAAHVSWQTPVYHGLSAMRCPAVLVLLGRLLCILAPALGGSCGRPACQLCFGLSRCCLAGGRSPIPAKEP